MKEGARYQIICGDVLDFCRDYEGEPFHALLCDPPYHLTSISDRYKTISERDKRVVNADPYRRTGRGFMNQQWDGGDITFQPETWAALLPLLHPGAFCMAFAGTRGFHRMAVAIEDAGYILHPLLIWIFGSGFPKATRIKGDVAFSEHRYGLQALKPALEPIAVFQKPYKGKPVECITKTGAGALNIGAGRIGLGGEVSPTAKRRLAGYTPNTEKARDSEARGVLRDRTNVAKKSAPHPEDNAGRWPANLLLDKESAAALDAQSGQSKSSAQISLQVGKSAHYNDSPMKRPDSFYQDADGASRFFFQSDFLAEEHDPFFYCGKAGRAERDAGLDCAAMPTGRNQDSFDGGVMLTGCGNERTPSRNPHPTVKPLRLTRYLASLLLPPDEYAPRRILVPFAGVASEMIGAHLAGWEEVVGVEQSPEYVEIGEARLKFWSGNTGLFESLTAEEDEAEPAQSAMEF